ncbi:MAG: DNA adenine methylase [Clostridium sp.]|nr:DNA adenine methylase [Clostridium sp.]
MIQSPLNYTGGKFKLLPQILPYFPKDIDVFVDLFCGGCNVGINVEANTVIYNDLDERLICLYNAFKNLDKKVVVEWIYQIIDKYGLSLVSKNGYDYYGCESGKGLGGYNKERFLKLRDDFNAIQDKNFNAVQDKDSYYYVMLYVLIVYAFNNQIRFNSKGEFNLPVGKRDFNKKMEDKLSAFIDKIQTQNCMFTCRDFREFDISRLGGRDFVYADPPYLITCASYNEQGGWDEKAERGLLAFLDTLSEKKIRFALSNVLRSKGRENHILIEWLYKHDNKYRAIPLNYSYSNSNYQTKDKVSASEEVLVVNDCEKTRTNACKIR